MAERLCGTAHLKVSISKYRCSIYTRLENNKKLDPEVLFMTTWISMNYEEFRRHYERDKKFSYKLLKGAHIADKISKK